MTSKREWKILAGLLIAFLAIYFMPIESSRFADSILEGFHLAKWYAREHVLLCLLPAFFIAGAIGVFVSKDSVMRYLGPSANKLVAYGVAAVSGTILAICSCTVLPLFAGIYTMGAGLGPATAFLYSGPAINVLAIILTARVLGVEIGIARAVGAIVFSVVIGALMHLIFRNEKREKARAAIVAPDSEPTRPLWQNALFFANLVGILVFANWGSPQGETGSWAWIYNAKWAITTAFSVGLGTILIFWFEAKWWKIALTAVATAIAAFALPGHPQIPFAIAIVGLSITTATGNDETREWFDSSWGFTKQILPLLLGGVVIAGFFLGRPGHEGVIPSEIIYRAVGGNSIISNFLASIVGAFMYFATLTEVPILQGLIGNGMGKGPALSLLLAGPALSLPNMLVIRTVLGTKKTLVFVALVVLIAAITGFIFGLI